MEPNKHWTIKIETHSQTFYITNIVYEDIARNAALGILEYTRDPNIIVKVFYVAPH